MATTPEVTPPIEPQHVPRLKSVPVSNDSYENLSGHEATVTPGKDYGNQSTIRDTDKRNGKARCLLNISAARA